MAARVINGGGKGGEIVAVGRERFRVNPTGNVTSFGALAKCASGHEISRNGAASAARRSKPGPEPIRE